MNSLGVREIGVNGGVGQGAVLLDRGGLQVGRSAVGQGIAAGIVVIVVAADKGSQVEDRVVADHARVSGRDVDGLDLGVLISVAHIAEYGIGASRRR
jgi:hypothetical protein